MEALFLPGGQHQTQLEAKGFFWIANAAALGNQMPLGDGIAVVDTVDIHQPPHQLAAEIESG